MIKPCQPPEIVGISLRSSSQRFLKQEPFPTTSYSLSFLLASVMAEVKASMVPAIGNGLPTHPTSHWSWTSILGPHLDCKPATSLRFRTYAGSHHWCLTSIPCAKAGIRGFPSSPCLMKGIQTIQSEMGAPNKFDLNLGGNDRLDFG